MLLALCLLVRPRPVFARRANQRPVLVSPPEQPLIRKKVERCISPLSSRYHSAPAGDLKRRASTRRLSKLPAAIHVGLKTDKLSQFVTGQRWKSIGIMLLLLCGTPMRSSPLSRPWRTVS
jgi:hypothetical protein